MKYPAFLVVLIMLVGLISCGGAPESGKEGMGTCKQIPPEWYNNPPSDPNYFYSAQTAISTDMQLAVDKAKQNGLHHLGEQIEAKIEGLTKLFQSEDGATEDANLLATFTRLSETVVSTMMNGLRIDKQCVGEEGSRFRSYILVELPWGDARANLVGKI